jgi:hypothetical protein
VKMVRDIVLSNLVMLNLFQHPSGTRGAGGGWSNPGIRCFPPFRH